MVSCRSFPGGFVLALCLFVAVAIKLASIPPDDPVNVVRQDGRGRRRRGGARGTGNTGGGGSGIAMPTLDAPVGPGGDGPFVCQAGGPCAVPDSPCLIGETRCEGRDAPPA